MCLVGVVLRRYAVFLILLIPTFLVYALFCSSIPTFVHFFKFRSFVYTVHDDYNLVGFSNRNMNCFRICFISENLCNEVNINYMAALVRGNL